MPLEIVTIPCLSDNYAFLAHDAVSGQTALIDAPEPGPILAALDARNWKLSHVLLTHHHWDHVDGLAGILEHHSAKVIGAAADAHRLPHLDLQVREGDTFEIGGEPVHVLDVSGHTIGHIAFYMPESTAVFTADSLMAHMMQDKKVSQGEITFVLAEGIGQAILKSGVPDTDVRAVLDAALADKAPPN